jgi:hypothetical protein
MSDQEMAVPLIPHLMQELPQTHVATAIVGDVDLANARSVFAL